MLPIGRQFEALVMQILESQRFSMREPDRGLGDPGFDFIGRREGEAWAIEVKYYRTMRPQVSLLESAAARLASRALRYQAKKGLLIVSCQVGPNIRRHLQEKFGLTLADREDLLYWASDSPELFDKLGALLEVDPRMGEVVIPPKIS